MFVRTTEADFASVLKSQTVITFVDYFPVFSRDFPLTKTPDKEIFRLPQRKKKAKQKLVTKISCPTLPNFTIYRHGIKGDFFYKHLLHFRKGC